MQRKHRNNKTYKTYLIFETADKYVISYLKNVIWETILRIFMEKGHLTPVNVFNIVGNKALSSFQRFEVS
jgi:hypothetical protein